MPDARLPGPVTIPVPVTDLPPGLDDTELTHGQRAVGNETAPVSTRTATSKDASTGSSTRAPGSTTSSAPSSGIPVSTGEAAPKSSPTKTRARTPGATSSAGITACWKRGSP
jgi:hypothetical protein